MLKASFKTILKILFAVAILTWLVKSDRLDFSLVGKALNNGLWPLIAFLLLITNALITAIRWKMLLELENAKLKLSRVFPINLIGQFFSTFLPGAVTGDFLKLLYIKDEDKTLKKTFLLSTVLIDRILGLIGLIFVAGIPSVFNYTELVSMGPKVKPLLSFNIMLLVGAISFIAILFLPKTFKKNVLKLLDIIPIIGERLSEVTQTFWKFGENKKVIISSICISVVVHTLSIVSFWALLHPFFIVQLGIDKLFSIVPIGFITVAIPISPSGAGVGHLAFEQLFKILNQSNGASFFNLYFLVTIATNMLGVIPYILWKKKHTLEEAETLEEV